MTTTHAGACFCGAIEIEATETPVEMGYCHCGSCRSYSGAPLTAFTLWKGERRFCTRCGGHVMTEHPGFGFTDVHASVFPTLAFSPMVHLNYAEAVLPVSATSTRWCASIAKRRARPGRRRSRASASGTVASERKSTA